MTPQVQRLRLVALVLVAMLAAAALAAGILASWDPSAITRVLVAATVALMLLADVRTPPTPPNAAARALLVLLVAEGAGSMASALDGVLS